MAYLLPRAFLVLMGWGITCAVIYHLRSNADPEVFYAAGAAWAFAGIVCFGYLHRQRRLIDLQSGPAYGSARRPT